MQTQTLDPGYKLELPKTYNLGLNGEEALKPDTSVAELAKSDQEQAAERDEKQRSIVGGAVLTAALTKIAEGIQGDTNLNPHSEAGVTALAPTPSEWVKAPITEISIKRDAIPQRQVDEINKPVIVSYPPGLPGKEFLVKLEEVNHEPVTATETVRENTASEAEVMQDEADKDTYVMPPAHFDMGKLPAANTEAPTLPHTGPEYMGQLLGAGTGFVVTGLLAVAAAKRGGYVERLAVRAKTRVADSIAGIRNRSKSRPANGSSADLGLAA